MAREGQLHIQQPKQHVGDGGHVRLRSSAAELSDADLLTRVLALAGAERETTVELVAHLAELDARKLYRGEGYGSLFGYCTGTLRLAEHAAYNRIEAARASREFPKVLDLLADGSLNLSTVRLLAPQLRPDNFESVVAMARGRASARSRSWSRILRRIRTRRARSAGGQPRRESGALQLRTGLP